MRKNKNYVPSDRQITHVREVLRLMSVLTKDNRFEDACNEVEEGEEVNTMNEWLDIIEDRERQEGRREGRREGRQEGRIFEYIDIRREDGYPDEKIVEGLIGKFHLTADQAYEYVKGLVTV